MTFDQICTTILDETCPYAELCQALDHWVEMCSAVTDIAPDRCFDAWSDDALLPQGVAINPHAAAHCALDYMRSVAFIRGTYAALNRLVNRANKRPVELLYAGCGPYATLVLPLLCKFNPGQLRIALLDIHQASLDSVKRLISHYDLESHDISTIKADACSYRHPHALDVIIAETMQRSLEQEPQYAITVNLAPQLAENGVFIPERINVSLCLAELTLEDVSNRVSSTGECDQQVFVERLELAQLCALTAKSAAQNSLILESQAPEHAQAMTPSSTVLVVPIWVDVAGVAPVLFTRIDVFEHYRLGDYESEITLPLKCHELTDLAAGDRYRVVYTLGGYPKFNFERLISVA